MPNHSNLTTASGKSDRLGFLDIARGVGIVTVTLFHSGFYPELITTFFAFKMQMYFLISGILFRPGATGTDFLGKRVRSLLLPYLFFNLFLLLARVVIDLHASTLSLDSLADTILGVVYSRYHLYPVGTEPNTCLMGNFNAPTWFLTSLMTSSMLFFPLVSWIGSRRDRLYWSVGLLILAAAAGSRLPILLPWSLDTAPVGALFMLVGRELSVGGHFIGKRSWALMGKHPERFESYVSAPCSVV